MTLGKKKNQKHIESILQVTDRFKMRLRNLLGLGQVFQDQVGCQKMTEKVYHHFIRGHQRPLPQGVNHPVLNQFKSRSLFILLHNGYRQ